MGSGWTLVLQERNVIWTKTSASGDERLQIALEKAPRRIRDGSSLGICLGAGLPARQTGGLGSPRGNGVGGGRRVARKPGALGTARTASFRTLLQRSLQLGSPRTHFCP